MRRKGISPLIAAVLLIAFTMAVAAILTAWVTTFTQQQTSAVGNRSQEIIQCSYAGLSIYDAVWDGSKNVDVSIANTGSVDFNNVSVHAFVGGSHNGTAYTGSLETADVKTVTIGNTAFSKPSKIRAISQNCPGKSDEVTSGDITTS